MALPSGLSLLAADQFLWGMAFAAIGVGFWVAGILVANHLYNRYTDDE